MYGGTFARSYSVSFLVGEHGGSCEALWLSWNGGLLPMSGFAKHCVFSLDVLAPDLPFVSVFSIFGFVAYTHSSQKIPKTQVFVSGINFPKKLHCSYFFWN